MNTEPIPQENIRYNKPNGCPADSIMFDNDEFQRLNYKYGPFTLDACASAFDAKCPEYCSIDKPFETADIRGHNIFFNPPFDEKVLPMLKHFEQIRQENPFSTKAVIVLPRWKDSVLAKSWQPILKKYKLIHTYPEGSYLFHTATEPLKTLPMPPITWDVEVYLADSTVEERETQSVNDSMTTANVKAMLSSIQGKAHIPMNYKPEKRTEDLDYA